MNKTEQAQQLRLAAEIIETGHPFEARHKNFTTFDTTDNERPDLWIWKGYEIRLALATPPDGRPLHNPHSLTAEQVGAGWRLLLAEEVDGRFVNGRDKCEWWSDGREWRSTDQEFEHNCSIDTIRVPLSVPWPEAPKPDPTTKTVPLGPEDVLPGSVFRMNHFDSGVWILPCATASNGISYANPDRECEELTWSQLNGDFQINRSIPLTGKWDANAWEPCSKEVPA